MEKDRYKYFRVEARELLDALSRGILDLERSPDDKALVARLLRHAHTLKGAARVVQQRALGELAHDAEDVLLHHRDEGSPPVPRDRIDALLRIADGIAAGVTALEPGAAGTERALSDRSAANSTFQDETLQSVRVDLRDLDALLAAALEAAVQVTGLRRQLASLEHAHEIARILADGLAVRRGDGEASTGFASRARPLADELRRTIVDAQRAVGARADEAEREIGQVRTFADRLRLLPARTLFGGLERAARDAARTLERSVTFETSGGDIRVDANVLSALREALLHVVRNAVAHGIEPEEERRRRGKPALGRVTLDVQRRGRKVAFVCRDDGRGIDVQAVRAAAQRRGVPLPDESAGPLQGDALAEVLMQGGVSTSTNVDEVSGRGVGLDVVRDVAARLKAEVALRSEPGRGTSVEIDVPVSLAAVTALHVEAAGLVVALPLDSVRETAFVEPWGVTQSGEGASIVHEGKVIPFTPLASVLGRSATSVERRFWSTVVIEAGERLLAVGADRLLGTSDIVVRPLPVHVAADQAIAGATLDAEGQPRLVLDPAGVIARSPAAGSPGETAKAAPRAPILVIDDSLTTRMLEQSILESAGYEVAVAISAEDALEKARSRRFGLFVVDVEMPGMDGLEFVRVTRADPRLSGIPAILVTSRGAPEDRKRGMDAGASAYIVKSEFDQQRLLEQIEELLS